MVDPAPLTALALDAALGWPAWLYARFGHPVGGFARIIMGYAARWNRQDAPALVRTLMGCGCVVLLGLVAGGGAGVITVAARAWGGNCAWMIVALAAWPALAQRSLYQHVAAVAVALDRGDLAAARCAVARIVGRDTDSLYTGGVARAAIESLAESFCDGVVAPCMWLLAAGLPGLWIYKAVNTADSLIGHREPPWGRFGWAAARTDDVMNFVPARLAAVLLCLAGRRGWRVLWRDHVKHASPNAGWSEAAMAGALGVRLGGPVWYEGVLADKPWLGDGVAADAAALHKAQRIYLRACSGLWMIAAFAALAGAPWRH